MRRPAMPFGILLVLPALLCGAQPDNKAQVVDHAMIWGRAPHNASTDLVRFHDRWFCVFREGLLPVSPDGALRVLTSADGRVWQPASVLTSPGVDLRDPEFSVTPDGRLLLNAVSGGQRRQSIAWFSSDGREWSDSFLIGGPGACLGRIAWHLRRAYSLGCSAPVKLYTSADGSSFMVQADAILAAAEPGRSSLLFLPGGEALALLGAELGKSRSPYRGWSWSDLNKSIAGSNLIRLPDERIVMAGRLYDATARTALCWLDPEQETLTEFLALPSGGDTGYPGMAFYDGFLWVSYYSSHEGRAMIYFAKVKLPPVGSGKKPPGRLTFGN